VADRRSRSAAEPTAAREEGPDRAAEVETSLMAASARQTDLLPKKKERRSPIEPKVPLDPRLRPFAHALADLLLADLLKYPPQR